ncbi:MAG: hypothetical protein ACTHJR_10500 [Sphingomonas sp.]|uniref:hypothetical protein n=1 Tax=Sphingomonas sp. TaxID=28214 RepID=UPI003F7FFF68
MQREIWFKKVFGSYFPVHWKGVVAQVALTFVTLSAVFLTTWLLEVFHVQDADDWSFLWIMPGVVAALILAERHSE